jgi:hypothetical protein
MDQLVAQALSQAFSLRRPDSSGRSSGSAVRLTEIPAFKESGDSPSTSMQVIALHPRHSGHVPSSTLEKSRFPLTFIPFIPAKNKKAALNPLNPMNKTKLEYCQHDRPNARFD